MIKTLSIISRNITDIATFYAEINRVFMAEEDWRLANSLDAFDDLLYGGYGAINGPEPVRFVWNDIVANRSALGIEATRALLTEKLQRPDCFNVDVINRHLEASERGIG